MVDLGRFGNVRERAVAIVVIENVRRSAINGRTATCGDVITNGAVAATAGAKVGIAPNVKVEASVAVIVKKSCACVEYRSEVGTGDTCLLRNIRERAIAVVVVENVVAILGYVKIGEAVIVIIAPNATQAVRCARNARLFRDVREGTIAVVVKERVAHGNTALVEVAAIDKVDVLPPVPVEIGYANTGPGLFQDCGSDILALEMNEVYACGLRDVGKLYGLAPLRHQWEIRRGQVLSGDA